MADPQVTPTYAPRTDFPTEKPREQTGPWAGTYTPGAVPKGMSPLFWDEINKSPEAEAIRKQRSVIGVTSGDPDAVIRRKIDELIARKWHDLPPEKQKEYVAQDKKGSKYTPDTPGARAEDAVTTAEKNAALGEADFSEFEATDGAVLREAVAAAATGNQAAIARLQEIMGSIKDPEIKEYVGDYISQAAQAGPSEQALADQRKEYLKLSGLTDPTITAEERLMQEMSRRQQEQDLRSQRGAFANELQSRGMYGSGAELSMNLAASQEAAQRRAYEEMAAQAHASDRAFDALGKANEYAGNIRDAEAQESQFRGTAADRATEWNKTFRDAYDKWVTEQQRETNRDTVHNAGVVFKAGTDVNRDAVAGADSVAKTGFGVVKGKVDNRNAGAAGVAEAGRYLGDIQMLEDGVTKIYG